MYKPAAPAKPAAKPEPFFRTMTTQEYKSFSEAVATAPKPEPQAAVKTVQAVVEQQSLPVREEIHIPASTPKTTPKPVVPAAPPVPQQEEQQELPMPKEIPWRLVGELYRSYVIVEQGEEAFLIDKHAAHERLLFEKLKANQEAITAQNLLTPIPCRMSPESCAELLSNRALLEELGFEVE